MTVTRKNSFTLIKMFEVYLILVLNIVIASFACKGSENIEAVVKFIVSMLFAVWPLFFVCLNPGNSLIFQIPKLILPDLPMIIILLSMTILGTFVLAIAEPSNGIASIGVSVGVNFILFGIFGYICLGGELDARKS